MSLTQVALATIYLPAELEHLRTKWQAEYAALAALACPLDEAEPGAPKPHVTRREILAMKRQQAVARKVRADEERREQAEAARRITPRSGIESPRGLDRCRFDPDERLHDEWRAKCHSPVPSGAKSPSMYPVHPILRW